MSSARAAFWSEALARAPRQLASKQLTCIQMLLLSCGPLHKAVEQYTMQKDIDEAMAELYGHHCNLPHEGRGAVGMTLLPAPDTVTFLMSCGGHPGWPCRGTLLTCGNWIPGCPAHSGGGGAGLYIDTSSFPGRSHSGYHQEEVGGEGRGEEDSLSWKS